MAEMNAAAYITSGTEYLEDEELDLAIADFTKAIQLDPNHAEAYSLRSRAHFERAETWPSIKGVLRRKKDEDNAIADIKMAYGLAPDSGKFSQIETILAEVGFGFGFTITGRTMNPGAEIKKRLIVLAALIVVAFIIGSIERLTLGVVYAVFGLIYGIGLVPWLITAKRDILDIPRFFKTTFSASGSSDGGFVETIKNFFFALVLTLLWKPFKLLCLLVYISPFMGIFQMVELLIDKKRNYGNK